jgi:AraC-like DNA-binding protein
MPCAESLATGALSVRSRAVHASLARFVEGYFVVDWRRARASAQALLIPSATAKYFYFPGDEPRAAISGPRIEPAKHRFAGAGRMLGVSFTPIGFRRLSRVAARELVGGFITDATDVFGDGANALHDQLAARTGVDAVFALLDEHWRTRLLFTESTQAERCVDACLSALDGAAPPRRVRELSEAVGVGERRLERAFLDVLGVRPALALRIARLHRTIRALRASDIALARAAADHGYSDQSHLTNDVRALTGLTPRTLAREVRAVGFFQDRVGREL